LPTGDSKDGGGGPRTSGAPSQGSDHLVHLHLVSHAESLSTARLESKESPKEIMRDRVPVEGVPSFLCYYCPMARRYFPKDVEELVLWYQRYISPLSLIAGFLADNFFLTKRVDLLRTNLLLSFYLLVCALGIVAINLIAAGRVKNQRLVHLAPVIPIAVQFAFGGLFSGYLSLYSRSASLATSWIFVLVIAGLLLGNERFMKFYSLFSFQISLYFGALFSFLIFYLPVVFLKIGPQMFLVSGGVSLGIITVFIMGLYRLVPEIVRANRTRVARSIVIIYLMFNGLYFANLIPPLPLSIKSAGVYHHVTHESNGTYTLVGEVLPWYEAYLNYNTAFHQVAGEPVYVYTAVFAPSDLATVLEYQWQKYDAATRAWVTTDTVSFPILGGRDAGYEGYTVKGNMTPGPWRVNVITQYGQVIGRVAFTVTPVTTEPTLVSVVK